MGAVGLDAIKMYEDILNDPSASQTDKNAARAWLNRYAADYINEAALDAQKEQVRIDTVMEKLKVQQQAAARGVPSWDYSPTTAKQQAAEAGEQDLIQSVIQKVRTGQAGYFPRTQEKSIYESGSATPAYRQAAETAIASQYLNDPYMSGIAQGMIDSTDAGGGSYERYNTAAAAAQDAAPYTVGDEEASSRYLSGGGITGASGSTDSDSGGILDSLAGISWQLVLVVIAAIAAIYILLMPTGSSRKRRATK